MSMLQTFQHFIKKADLPLPVKMYFCSKKQQYFIISEQKSRTRTTNIIYNLYTSVMPAHSGLTHAHWCRSQWHASLWWSGPSMTWFHGTRSQCSIYTTGGCAVSLHQYTNIVGSSSSSVSTNDTVCTPTVMSSSCFRLSRSLNATPVTSRAALTSALTKMPMHLRIMPFTFDASWRILQLSAFFSTLWD